LISIWPAVFRITELDARDRLVVFLVQRMEYHDLVDPVDEFQDELGLTSASTAT